MKEAYLIRIGEEFMIYSIGLDFDEKTEQKIKKDMIKLCEKGISTYALEYKVPPHITLSIFEYENQDISVLKKVVDSFKTILKPYKVNFSSIGTFYPPVLFYAPVVTKQLMDINEKLYYELKDAVTEFNQYYIPDNWVPHVALGYKMTQNNLLVAFEYVQEIFSAFEGRYTKLVLGECNPYKEIYVVDLEGK